jgi:hypothetical protein
MDPFGLFMLRAAVMIGTTVGITVRLIQLIGERIRGHRFARSVGRPAALGWALGFAIAAFAAGAFMSIGVLVLPFAIIVCGVAAWRCRALPEGAIGASLGTGFVLGIVGLMNSNNTPRDRPPCNGAPVTLKAGEHASFSCGGVDGASWLPLAGALVFVAFAGQIILERRKRGGEHANRDLSQT